MHLGRERPPQRRSGTVIGGWQRGSLTPQMTPSPLLAAALTATRAAKSAARLTVVKLLIAKNIATSPADEITFLTRLVDQRTATSKGGTTAPESVVPPFFLRFRGFCLCPGERGWLPTLAPRGTLELAESSHEARRCGTVGGGVGTSSQGSYGSRGGPARQLG